jgi:hypothetical protein
VSKKVGAQKNYEAAFLSLTRRLTGIGYLVQFSNVELPPSQAEMYGIGENIRVIAQELEEMQDLVQFPTPENTTDKKRGKK